MVDDEPVTVRWSNQPRPIGRALFTDRDGVLAEVHPGHPPDAQVQILPATGPALIAARRAGYAIVVVSNQSGVADGTVTRAEMLSLNRRMLAELDPRRAVIDYVLICPHAAVDGCHCRKPRTGLVRALERQLEQAVVDGWFVGDQRSDLLCGRELGLHTALVGTGAGAITRRQLLASGEQLADLYADTFANAVRHILS